MFIFFLSEKLEITLNIPFKFLPVETADKEPIDNMNDELDLYLDVQVQHQDKDDLNWTFVEISSNPSFKGGHSRLTMYSGTQCIGGHNA